METSDAGAAFVTWSWIIGGLALTSLMAVVVAVAALS
jgi:hypothetical protein